MKTIVPFLKRFLLSIVVSLLTGLIVTHFAYEKVTVGYALYFLVLGFAAVFPGSLAIALVYYVMITWIGKRGYGFWGKIPGNVIMDVLFLLIAAVVLYLFYLSDDTDGEIDFIGASLYYLIFTVVFILICRIRIYRKLKKQ